MKTRKKTYKVSREKAIKIAMNQNCVPIEVAKRYTDCELKEVLRQASGIGFKLEADF